MKKWVIRIVIALVVVVVVVLGGVFFYINSLAKTAIEKGATYAMGVQTTVGSVNVGLLRGQLDLSDLDIANPPGFTGERFLGLGHGDVAVSLGSLTKDTVEIPHIRLKKINLDLEEAGGKANFAIILHNLSKLSKSDSSADKKEGKGYIVREILLTDINVNATVEGQRLPITIDQIKLNDVGSGDGQGVNMEELSRDHPPGDLSIALETS